LGKYGLFSLKWMLERRVKDPLARSFLSVQTGDHGLPPKLAPFAVQSGVMGHYFNGGFYPLGGGMAIPLALRKALKKSGGEIRLRSRVAKILIEDRRAVGVALSDGSTLRARRIFSNADPQQTYGQMIGPEHLSRRLKKKLAKTRYSLPSISLFFAIDCNPRELGMDSGNIWYLKTGDLDRAFDRAHSPNLYDEVDEFDGLFVTALSLKDPTQYNGRHHTLEAVTFVGFEAFRAFMGPGREERAAEYLRFKEKIQRMMLKTLEKALPGIGAHIVYVDVGTPVTNAHFVNATDGACYGTEKSRFQMGPFSYSMRSEIENLFLCGASTTAHGVSGAAHSGIDAVAVALECKRKDILRATGQRMRTYSAERPESWPASVRAKIERHRTVTESGALS
jgi:phytoene dehydrogenase-like protein